MDEYLQLAAALQNATSKPPSCNNAPSFGVYIETKNPSYFRSLGFNMEQMLLDTLQKWGYEDRCSKSTSDLSDPAGFISSCGVILQSFENNLANLTYTPYPLIQLLSGDPDEVQVDTGKTYGYLMSDAGLQEIATWADGIGPDKTTVINYNDPSYPSLGLLERAHSNNLYVLLYSLLFLFLH